MTDHPCIHICLVNWNQYDDTAECLESLRLIAYPRYQVLVIDNGSTDGSCDRLMSEFPWATYLRNDENIGFAGGNNVGIQYALDHETDYVFLLNNDTVVDPQVLEKLIVVAESDGRIGIVGPAIYSYSDRDVFWTAAMEKTVPDGKIFPHYVMRGKGEVDSGQYSRVEDVDMINACALLISREAIENVGKLDDEFFIYNEDSDWNDRVASAGYRIVYVPDGKVWHKGSLSLGGQCSPASWFYTVRNELLFLKKRTPWRWRPLTYWNYLKENFWFWKGFKEKGDQETARAVLDGMWCGIAHKVGRRTVEAPGWFERLCDWKMRWDNRRIAEERAQR
jgi:GT2 family glycosyltransferase